MKLIYHGHSCFTVESEGHAVVFDPYADGSVRGYPPLRLTADAVYCSHDHRDHNAKGCVTLTGGDCPLSVTKLPSFHDRLHGLRRGKNTVHVLAAEGMRLAHLGDLGHMLSGTAIAALQGLDALLIPVGGYYTIDPATAKKLVDKLSPRVVIPMHYRLGDKGHDVIAELSDFLALCDNVTEYDTNTLTLTPDTPRQTAILRS